nr:phytoene synthase [Tanacetum cinerariifolium]
MFTVQSGISHADHRTHTIDKNKKEDMDIKPKIVLLGTFEPLNEAFDRCGEVCVEHAKTFYLALLPL